MTPLVLALVGTDHHPFDRMVQWMDAAALRRPDARFVVQHGVTQAPMAAEGHDFLAHGLMLSMLAEASVVVCHGGPGTIMDAREAGHVPLCVPRDPRLGEHVDGHQQRFAAMVGEAGVVRTVTRMDAFNEELDRALADASKPGRVTTISTEREAARAQLAAELDTLISVRPRRLARLYRASA